MKISKVLILAFLLISLLNACEEYEEYIKDYDYSAVYFASQKPLRTIVARENMTFRFGVVLGGVRENTQEEWVKYRIEPDLLNVVEGANKFKLLPESYYTLSNSELFKIPAGEFIGDVTLTLNRELFTSDPLATQNTYALPIEIYETSADSILKGDASTAARDYTIIVVKYVSPYHGVYYQKGIEETLNDDGTVVAEVVYSEKDLSQNISKEYKTISLNEISTSGLNNGRKGNLELSVNDDYSVDIDVVDNNSITLLNSSGTYNSENSKFFLDYLFADDGINYHVTDTLILRQKPEFDLRYEEW
ncbi:protein of unknown function [Mariniphaga anaerophila]|uniref:BT-3987-like N-terminal domain-containing protein n=1 Tax=Mariniphaga anaerophila TaxID=1484053 RepID=A0A1M4V8D4_9BACT|nr:DUF1735 domain-containing protein [Mariniphaga anaerophila]SHE65147.1 protein of unknown function [Mariniphaga anaerophila]